VAGLITQAGLSFTRRTAGEMPGAQVYLADTMGELGTWYALTDMVFLGGSLQPIGGHNPFEVAQSGASVLSGTHVANFAETYAEMESLGAARMIGGADDLVAQLDTLLTDAQARRSAMAAAVRFTEGQTDRLDMIADRLIAALEIAR
jgi:3-deoxy-D-manno-octulosonic-acid transferase